MVKSSKKRKARGKPAKKPRAPAKRAAIELDFSGAPKKKRPSGPPAPRTTTHKKRTAWFQARAAWPYREPSTHSRLRERSRAAAALAPQAGAAQWELVGPTNVGGRMTSVGCAPKKPNTIWAGAAGGGGRKRDDGGPHRRGRGEPQAAASGKATPAASTGEGSGTASRRSISGRLPSIPPILRLCTAVQAKRI